MRLPCLLFALLACAGLCQQTRLPSALTGTVEKMVGGVLYINTGQQSFAVRTDDRTVVWKDRREQGVSAGAVGEKVRIRMGTRPLGEDVATRVSAAMVTFSGVAGQLSPVVGRLSAAAHGSAVGRRFRVGNREVCITLETAIGLGQPFEEKMVHVMGWDFGDGTVDATRIAVYNTDLRANISRP